MPYGVNPDDHSGDLSDLQGCGVMIGAMVLIAVCVSVLLVATGVWG